MNTIIEKIRAEIESKIRDTNNDTSVGAVESLTISKTLRNVLSLLSDLEKEEKPIEGLEEDFGLALTGEIERFITTYCVNKFPKFPEIARHFAKWGAKWWKEQDNVISRQAEAIRIKTQQMCYEKGKADMKEQMMKDAVEGKIAERRQGKLYARCQVPKTMKAEFGDKVRIIILPKED